MKNEPKIKYRLLKATPWDSAGAELYKYGNGYGYASRNSHVVDGRSYPEEVVENTPEWFEKIEPTTDNKPQLSAEMQSKYNELRPYIKSGVVQEKIDEVFNWFATALEEQKKEATFTLVNTTKPFFYAGYEAGKKDERQKVLSEVEGWMVELRKQAGLCNDAANSHLEQQRASRLVEMICDIVAKLEEMKK